MEPTTGKAKYYTLMEALKEQILSGTIKPGQKLPSENELTREYALSRHTVRKALALLENEGYITARHGKGTFCSERVIQRHNSKNIAVTTTYLSDYIFPRLIQGMDRVLSENGYSIILKNTCNSRSKEEKVLKELLDKPIDGLIIEPSKSQILCRHINLYEMLDKYQIPYVFIQGCYPQMADKPCILMDDCKGGYLLTRHLLETGRRNIIGIFKADDSQGAQRHKGYVQALQESGILYDPENVIWFHTGPENQTVPDAFHAARQQKVRRCRRLLQRPDRARRHLHAGRKGNLRAGRHRRHRIRQLADRPEQSDRDHDHCPSAGKTR